MENLRNQIAPYVQHVSETTGYLPADANSGVPHELEIRIPVPWPSMLNSQQNPAESTRPMPLSYPSSTVSKSLHRPGKVGNGRRLVAAPRTQRKLAPKDINAGSDTGSSHFLSITSGAKRLRRDSTSTCQNEPFNNSQIETRNGNNTTQNTTPYSSATRTQNSGLLLARGSHTPPDLFQAYSALCVVVDFCEQQPPGYLEYKDAVALGKWKERLKARTRAIQHGEGEQR